MEAPSIEDTVLRIVLTSTVQAKPSAQSSPKQHPQDPIMSATHFSLVATPAMIIGEGDKETWKRHSIFRTRCISKGRPWQFDHRSIHDGAKNTHSFLHNGRKLILEPLKPPDIETTMCTTFLAEARESGMFFSPISHEKNKYAKKPEIETASPVQAAPSTTVDSHDASTFMPVMAYSTSSSTEDLFFGEGCNMELYCVDWDSPPIFDVCLEEDHDSFLDTPPIFDEYGADESEFCVTTPSLSVNLFVEYADPV
ncbi:hypothetical protein IFM89_034562 [Coptis chinensis]|uniref:Uncharacterized protein n=1 Tax=Coptis chinensis TaxID=261450 RepID=A0A835HRF8_9MAGN|nr:hypothetical protein IFM89_034562 [Coptis chinensis]